MSTVDMWIRPSPHTRMTEEEAVSASTARPGTSAENARMMVSSAVTCPPSDRTKASASAVLGWVSRTITPNRAPGCRAAAE